MTRVVRLAVRLAQVTVCISGLGHFDQDDLSAIDQAGGYFVYGLYGTHL